MEPLHDTGRAGFKGGLFVPTLLAHAIPVTPKFCD